MPMAVAQTLASTAPAGTALPGDSIYQVAATLTDQNGRAFKLVERRGQPTLVSMFYNTCKFVCPMLIDTMELTQQGLTAQERAQLSMLLLTFDPARDNTKALKSIAEARVLDTHQWTLARTDATSVRKIAATLGIQYRLLADGEYNHTTVLVLLDADGRIVGRTKRIGASDPDFIKLVKQTLQANSRRGS
ncbi:MAG: SCO family protein [Burkholderiales bacterium PBB3]|nr:MAG: SCO family protein [Burkholderiales bacterium PBB3]